MTERVAILVPLMRPQNIWRLVTSISESTPEPHYVYFMTSDDECCELLDDMDVMYWRDDGDTWGHRLNTMFHNTWEPFVFLGADDLVFHPGWYTNAIVPMNEIDGVISVNDCQSNVGTSALVSRSYIENESGCVDVRNVIIHPSYHHNFSERELYETAARRGRFGYCPSSVVEHLHPDSGKAPLDPVYELGRSMWDEDEALFLERRPLWDGNSNTLNPALVTRGGRLIEYGKPDPWGRRRRGGKARQWSTD